MTTPVQVNSTIEFIVEYRNDMNGGLEQAFWLNEYGVFVSDPEQGEILLYYGSLVLQLYNRFVPMIPHSSNLVFSTPKNPECDPLQSLSNLITQPEEFSHITFA